jgi:DNA phosphorothioation-associated putative methyltransferase
MIELVGKVVANAVYVVPDNVDTLPPGYSNLIEKAKALAEEFSPEFNVLKISPKSSQISFLAYEDLVNSPFPALRRSVAVNIEKETVSERSYTARDNPPIFHRKELLFGNGHPKYEGFALLTRTLEGLGLFGETSRIGNKQDWEALLSSVGVQLQGHRVIRSELDPSGQEIARHRTALVRSSLSSPIEIAIKFELLTEELTLFDYGCGRGDDIALLAADGFDAVGWDPYYAVDGTKRSSQVVNLGFVLNVIEAPSERVSVLQDAYGYAEKVLLVAALIDGQKSRSQARRYRDGIITQRGTFQKFFTQMELRELIEASLNTEAISVGPGLFIVIRDEAEREAFLRTRHKRASHQVLPRISSRAKRLIELTSQEDQALSTQYWRVACELGRLPRPSELPAPILEWVNQTFGNPKKAAAWLVDHFGRDGLERAAQQKKDQLVGYLALAIFRRKKLRNLMTPELRREVKRTFGTLKEAEAEAFQALRSMADPDALANDCMIAAEQGCAQIDSKSRLVVLSERIVELPSALQVVIGVAEWFGDDLSSVDVVNVAPERAVVTFHHYRDFQNEPFPMLEARLRVGLIKQTVRYLPELQTEPPRLFIGKSDFLADVPEEQTLLDAAIRAVEPWAYYNRRIDTFDLIRSIARSGQSWNGIELGAFFRSLPSDQIDMRTIEWQILDHAVLPALDDNCGRFLTFRNLIECGETQERLGLANLPMQPESYGALRRLALDLLDPVIEEYGMIKLTYGFSSPELARAIPARIAPKLDQHASCELNRRRLPICPRLGAAVDFIVEYESMLEVAQWIVQNCQFDRLYYYGDDRPIHVSVGPECQQAVVLMKLRRDGREGPQKVLVDKFRNLP